MLLAFFYIYFVNLIKKSLTICLWKNSQVDPYFLCFQTGSF